VNGADYRVIDTEGRARLKLEKNFYFSIHRYKTMKFSLGGSSLNSSRILAAMGQQELLFFGAIGDDQNGKIVKEILKRSNVNAW
jgi:sugar/nucleoside kinase (ribokinase family)